MTSEQQNGFSSNGHNGNHSKGIFELRRSEDPLYSQIVPAARREVQKDNTLCFGARVLFDYLTDCSLWAGHNVRPGVVRFSNFDLAVTFGVSVRAIQEWKAALKSRGRIWTTDKKMRNSYPLTTYHVAAICGQAPLPFGTDFEEGHLAADDTEQLTNRQRRTPIRRDHRGRWTAPPPATVNTAETQEKPVNTAPKCENQRATHEEICVPRTKKSACGARENLRAGHEPICVPGTNQSACGARENLRAGHAEICADGTNQTAVLKEAQMGDSRFDSKRVGHLPPDLAWQKWTKSLDKMFPRELEQRRAEIQLQIKRARSGLAKGALKRKLDEIESRLNGPPVPDDPAPAPVVASIISKIAQRQPTAEELAAHEAFMAQRRKGAA